MFFEWLKKVRGKLPITNINALNIGDRFTLVNQLLPDRPKRTVCKLVWKRVDPAGRWLIHFISLDNAVSALEFAAITDGEGEIMFIEPLYLYIYYPGLLD